MMVTGQKSGDVHALLTKREVKVAGYWPSPFFTHIKKRIFIEQAWSIKDLLDGFTFKLKLQKIPGKARHETVLLG